MFRLLGYFISLGLSVGLPVGLSTGLSVGLPAGLAASDTDGSGHHGLARAIHAVVDHVASRGGRGGSGGGSIDIRVGAGGDEDEEDADSSPAEKRTEKDAHDNDAAAQERQIEVHIPELVTPRVKIPRINISVPKPPAPPTAPVGPESLSPKDGGVRLRKFSVHTKDAPAVDVLHRIAQSAGWSLTVAGVGDEKVSLDINDVDPREAVRQVLRASRSWGVLRGDRLVVLPASDGGMRAGDLVERRGKSTRVRSSKRQDLLHVLQGDLVVPRGTVVNDAVVVGGSLTVEPGALVQGDAVAVLGGINVEPGGLVMGDSVAVVGALDIEPGGQVLGEHVQVGLGKLFAKSSSGRRPSFLRRIGVFGLFPTLALFALIYLVGLLALFAAPDRLRNISATLMGNPVRSFFVGFLSWLLVLPAAVLLVVTLVGIPLLPLLPLLLFVSFALGLSAIALRIGEVLPAGPGQKFVPSAALGMGMVVLALVSFVPLLGFTLLALVQFAAVGAVVASRGGRPARLGTAPPPAQVA